MKYDWWAGLAVHWYSQFIAHGPLLRRRRCYASCPWPRNSGAGGLVIVPPLAFELEVTRVRL
jgi:hypothetical protein